MATRPQGKSKPSRPLDKQKVRVALAIRGWTQAHLANVIKRSLTATNLTINHGSFPTIAEEIRKALSL